MNNTTTRYLTVAAIFMAATLVIGATFAATTSTTQSAFAYKKRGGQQQENSKNGNTVTIEECKNKGSASGFDTAVDQECENLICTHPGENATCTQEGVTSTTPTSTPTPTPEPITTTLRIIKKVVCLPADPDCSVPNNCEIRLSTSSQGDQSFSCPSAIGNGRLVTLQPGDSFSLRELQSPPAPFFNPVFSGDCGGTIAEGQHLTCTITNRELE